MFRFLAYVLMFIPSNVNIPSCFTHVCLLTNTRPFINLARWVKVLIFQRKKTFKFLSDLLNSHLKLLVGELIELWQKWFRYKLALWVIGNSTNIDSFTVSKKFRWYNILGLVFYSAHSLYWHYLLKMRGNLFYQTFDGSAFFRCWSLTIYVLHK